MCVGVTKAISYMRGNVPGLRWLLLTLILLLLAMYLGPIAVTELLLYLEKE